MRRLLLVILHLALGRADRGADLGHIKDRHAAERNAADDQRLKHLFFPSPYNQAQCHRDYQYDSGVNQLVGPA